MALAAAWAEGGGLDQGMSKDALRGLVEEAHETMSYNARRRLVDELYIFLSRMKPDDGVCTIFEGRLHVGKITGPVSQTRAKSGLWDLRRPVEWQNAGYLLGELPEEVQQKLSIQRDVADLTSVQAIIDGLGLTDEELADEAQDAVGSAVSALAARRELALPEPGEGLAEELLVHDARWLREVRDLLWDERQLIFYGPPGTGKTYLAQKLAEFLGGGPEQVKLVQFHPSYAYEDFFEGFRPQEDPETRQVAFRLTAGPLRELADLASGEGNRHVPHFLIIDEINRANLAKVFGELYFLLEYRNRSVRLTYSGDDFALPPNLFVIGTMNTADRSIALVDAAMRRRFAFVELAPRAEPTKGMLRRWLAAKGRDPEPADLLDELNRRISDPDFQVGPSYLMKPGVYRDGGLERTWRTKILPLLEEYHYGEDVKIEQQYGLASLRDAIAPPPA
ncbi:McrB family protein [Actinomadura sp. 3N508]|uniref:McrB family protein n=1 Tax=Actinomadura sp. 3N508 TaxID=3375153 RepID=UPI0037A28426